MAQTSTYVHLTETRLIGYVGNTITSQITLTRTPTYDSTPIFAIQDVNGRGYEIAPSPDNNGTLSYRYNLTNTNTILRFDSGAASLNVQKVFVGALGQPASITMLPDATTGNAYMTMKTGDSGLGILFNISSNREPAIQFYKSSNIDVLPNLIGIRGAGTLITASTIRTQNFIASTISSIDSYFFNTNTNTATISSLAAKTAIISSLTYTTIVGPAILQIQTIAF
jgi:hypothetical protein